MFQPVKAHDRCDGADSPDGLHPDQFFLELADTPVLKQYLRLNPHHDPVNLSNRDVVLTHPPILQVHPLWPSPRPHTAPGSPLPNRSEPVQSSPDPAASDTPRAR